MSVVREAIRRIGQKPVTRQYPIEKANVPRGFRGRPVWDMKKCIGCLLCQSTCPSGAIEIVGRGLTCEIKYFLDRCIFCAQCSEICPVKAIAMSEEFELAGFDRSKMLYWYKREPEQKPAAKT